MPLGVTGLLEGEEASKEVIRIISNFNLISTLLNRVALIEAPLLHFSVYIA